MSCSKDGRSDLVIYYNFLCANDAEIYFTAINNLEGWSKIGSREVIWFGDVPYNYGRYHHSKSNEFHPVIFELITKISNFFNTNCNSVLLNRYSTGESHIPWHQDNEPELGDDPVIYSLSLGECRTFEIKNKKSSNVHMIDPPNGSLIIMKRKLWRYSS